MLPEQTTAAYEQLTTKAGFVDLPDRTILKLTGKDRHSFLHNFCTADVKGLETGQCCEAFILNGKGKVLGFVYLIACEDFMFVTTVAGQFDTLFGHLDKYIIREDVQISDVSTEFAFLFVCGPLSDSSLLQMLNQLPAESQVQEFEVDSQQAWVAKLELAGVGFLLLAPSTARVVLSNNLENSEITNCLMEAMEVVRIESATPKFCCDVSDSNLPQELRRDEKAISFTKGCYLGQETVARIDAIGHVNRFLVQLRFEEQVEVGCDIEVEQKKVGVVTSFSWSPKFDAWIGLGYLKRQMCKPGNKVTVGKVNAEVLEPSS